MAPGVQHSRGIPGKPRCYDPRIANLETFTRFLEDIGLTGKFEVTQENSLLFSRLKKLRKTAGYVYRTNLRLFKNILKSKGFESKLP